VLAAVPATADLSATFMYLTTVSDDVLTASELSTAYFLLLC